MTGVKKVIKTSRPNWDETFMMLALTLAKRAACKYHEIASVFVDEDHKIIATGYNGPTRGDVHCLEAGCAKVDGDPVTKKLKRCRGAHSEINAIMNAGNPAKLKGSTLYVTGSPCYDCMKSLNNVGVKRIVFFEEYKRMAAGNGAEEVELDEVAELCQRSGIALTKFEGDMSHFENILNKEKNISSSCSTC